MNLEKIFKNTILLYFLSTVVFLIISFTLEKNFLGEELYLIDSEIDLYARRRSSSLYLIDK